MKDLQFPSHPNLLVGFDTRDDAGVYKMNSEQALIQTVDFFTPMVDDPFIFGQIAATNALNDIYAMGGKPLLALNLVCYPQCGDMWVLQKILAGGLSKVTEAGALLIGGHTIDDNEPKYGLSVSGLVHPDRLISNSGALPGNSLFLTKPLGSGVVATAIKAEMASDQAIADSTFWMTMLNKDACEVMQEIGVRAATDITGFGLVGHLYELASASDVAVELNSNQVQLMTGALDYAQLGLIPGGAYTNRDYLADKVEYSADLDATLRDLLFSPETAGGLLVAVDESKAEDFCTTAHQRGCVCYKIGVVRQAGFKAIKIK